jgi:hypothetical protein
MSVHTSSVKRRLGFVAGTAVFVSLVVPSTAFSVSYHAKSKHTTKSSTCLTGAKLSAAVKATWPNPKVSAGLSPGQKLCTYLSPSSGETFLISHEALDGSSLKELLKDSFGSGHFTSVSGIGKAAIHGAGGVDILLVQQGSEVYEFLDNSGASSVNELKAVAKLVVP